VTVRIVVADDHAVVREGLRALLAAVPGYELAGTAATAPEAVRAAMTLHPNVLVLDIQMPGAYGIDAARELSRVAPDVAILGYILKGADPDDIIKGHRLRRSGRSDLRAGDRPTGTGIPHQGLGK
jgi:chemotaxis response regulator CheB